MIGIFDILFEVLPYIIWGAGPFCVFKGMGTGKDSGKLLFKKLYSDSGISITEDSTSLDIKSSGGSGQIPIDNLEIAFGDPTSTGLTSSTFKVCGWSEFDTKDAVVGMSIIGGSNHENRSGISGGSSETRTSLIIGGSGSWITASVCSSAITGGGRNCIGKNSAFSAVVGGYQSALCCSVFSTIVGSYLPYLYKSSNSSILTSQTSQLKLSDKSIIMNSKNTELIRSTQSTVIVSDNSKIYRSISTVVSGYNGYVDLSRYSTNLNGYRNITRCSECTSILNGKLNRLTCVSKSTIINGYQNCLESREPRFINSMTIVNGYQNCDVNYDRLSNRPYKHQYSTIINGQLNRFCDGSDGDLFSCYDTIINGRCNVISGQFNTIINGYKNYVGRSVVGGKDFSTIISGNNSIISSNLSTSFTANKARAVIGGTLNTSTIFSNGQSLNGAYSSIIGETPLSRNNSIFGSIGVGQCIFAATNSNIFRNNTINSSIFTIQDFSCGFKSNIIGSGTFSLNYNPVPGVTFSNINNTIISIGSSMSALYGSNLTTPGRGLTISNSAIVGGFYHNMVSAVDSVILGGCCNRIVEACRSSIIGGMCNRINGFYNNVGGTPLKGVKNSVILGGYKNCLEGLKPIENSVIIGGQNLCNCNNQTVLVQNMALYGCLGYYNFASSTLSPGLDSSKSGVIASLTVCHGIIVAWS